MKFVQTYEDCEVNKFYRSPLECCFIWISTKAKIYEMKIEKYIQSPPKGITLVSSPLSRKCLKFWKEGAIYFQSIQWRDELISLKQIGLRGGKFRNFNRWKVWFRETIWQKIALRYFIRKLWLIKILTINFENFFFNLAQPNSKHIWTNCLPFSAVREWLVKRIMIALSMDGDMLLQLSGSTFRWNWEKFFYSIGPHRKKNN